jgi:hypothetical protein
LAKSWEKQDCVEATQADRADVRQGTRGQKVGMKFLVVWKMEISRLSAEMMKTVLRMPDYAKPLEESGKVIGRYHIVGYHGGAWIFNVESNDELEMLLAGTRLQFLAL